jgi:hypothetical protein
LSELAADYQDEHSTSTQAAEMLERETVERLRLEKELKELQVITSFSCAVSGFLFQFFECSSGCPT